MSSVTVADHFSEFYLTGSSAPLPVELTTFTATAEGRDARLAWTTASEKNSARFEVERNADGKTFERIGRVAAQGNKASPTAYAYLDQPTTPPTLEDFADDSHKLNIWTNPPLRQPTHPPSTTACGW